MMAVSHDDDGQMPSRRADDPEWRGTSSLARLEQRVTNIEDSLKDIKFDFKTIRDEIIQVHRAVVAFGKPQYSVITGFAGVVLVAAAGLWTLAISPVKDDVARQYSTTDKLTIRLEDEIKLLDTKKLDRAAFDETRAELNARIAELNARLKRQ